MLGQLLQSLTVNGIEYPIQSDYRNILRIIAAFGDDELTDNDKVYVLMYQIYEDFHKIPKGDIQEAYEKAVGFMECFTREDRPSPRVVDWNKDEQLIFPAINKVAGFEVRSVPYMHWWTFMGYFQGIDREDTWGYILTLRQKKAKHKKLEKYEKEFWNANRSLCELKKRENTSESAGDALKNMFNELLKEGGAE